MRRACFGAVLAAALFVSATFSPTSVHAQDADCSTPKKATITFLANLPPNGDRADLAVQCFDFSGANISGADQAAMAGRLKRVLDQEGWFIAVDDLPDTADPEGDRFLLTDALEDIYLEKVGGDWKISAHSIRAIAGLYAEYINEDVDAFVEALPSWARATVVADVATWQLLGLLIALLLGFLVRSMIASLVAQKGAKALDKHASGADADSLTKASKPIGTLGLALVLWYMLPLLRFGVKFNEISGTAVRVMAALSAVMLMYRLVDLGTNVWARRAGKTETKLDDQLVPLVRKSLKVFVVLVGVIFVLQNMDVDVGSLLAGASLGGLAFTLAAQDTVANLFGSVSVFADQPFQVGDWVVIDGHEGVVEEVGMRSTRIRTFYNSVISLPNSKVANAPIDNYGRRQFRRCFITLGLTYDSTPDQIQAFVEGCRGILVANDSVRQEAHEVHFKGFGDSALEVMLYFFFVVDTWTEELTQKQAIFLEIMRLADKIGVSFAFPTQTLHIETVAKPHEVPAHVEPTRDELEGMVLGFGPGGEHGRPQGRQLTSHGFYPGTERKVGSSQQAVPSDVDPGEL